MTQEQFFIWLASGGGATVALAFVLQRIPAFEKLPSDTKAYITLGGSVALALGAYAYIALVPADIQAALAPWFQIVYGVVAAWVANQVAHKADPQA